MVSAITQTAIEHFDRALSAQPARPVTSPGATWASRIAHFFLGSYDEASAWVEKALAEPIRTASAARLRIATAMRLAGRLDAGAESGWRDLRQLDPAFASLRRRGSCAAISRPNIVREVCRRACALRDCPNDRAAPPCRHRVSRRRGLLAADGPRRERHAGGAESHSAGSGRPGDRQPRRAHRQDHGRRPAAGVPQRGQCCALRGRGADGDG